MANLRSVTPKKGLKERFAKLTASVQEAIDEGREQDIIDNLTERQKSFVEQYLVDFNAAAASVRAGYKSKPGNENRMGYELMQNPAIKLAIIEATKERADKSVIKPDYVIRKVMRTIEKAEQDNAHNAVLKGCELLARHLGMFIERQEISGPDGGAIKYEQVKEAADGFTRAISSLIEREGPGEGIIITDTGSSS